MTAVTAWIFTALAFGALDAIWLTQFGPRLYRPLIGDILRSDVNWPAAIAFYLIYVSGIVFFAVLPALETQSFTTALLNGAVFGFVAYATYDLTNHATMKVWDIRVTVIDMAWGTSATALAGGAGFWLTQGLSG